MDKKADKLSDTIRSGKEREDKLEDITDGHIPSDQKTNRLTEFLSRFKIHRSAGKKKPIKLNPKILFVILAAVCLSLIILSSVFEQVARPFKAAASFVVFPAQDGINTIGNWLAEKVDDLKTIEELTEENKQLKQEIEELTDTNNILRLQNSEIDKLNEILDLKSQYQDYETIAVKIVSKDASNRFSTFIVNKGSADGIKKNMNVVSSGGLVGAVTDVSLNYSTVMTIINDESNISAMFENGSDLCIVEGGLSEIDNENLMEFSSAGANVKINEGDALVTSYVSSLYLPGLLIGYVSDYETDGNELTQSGHIVPSADFDKLSEVLIITELKETSD